MRELRHEGAVIPATAARRPPLACQPHLRMKRVGFHHYCARASARGGGDAGYRFASKPLMPVRLSSERSTLASSFWCASSGARRCLHRRLFRVEHPRASSSAQNEARGLPALQARALARGDGHAGDRLALSSTSLAVFSAWNEARGPLPQLCVSLGTRGRSYRQLLRVDLPSPVNLSSE